MIDGYQMWCAIDDAEKEYFSIREILGFTDQTKLIDKAEEIFGLIEKVANCGGDFTKQYIACYESYVLDSKKENTSTSFWLKCLGTSEDLHFIRRKKRSRKEERKVLEKIIYLKIYKKDLEKIKEKEEE